MALPVPQSGQVIRYAYLWWHEARAGREDGTKDRPCSVILTRVTEAGLTIAYVLPITHTPPGKDEDGVEIPLPTKHRLGLDEERSWIITTELNRFIWPGPDLRTTASGDYVYGALPEQLTRKILKQVKQHALSQRLKSVARTE